MWLPAEEIAITGQDLLHSAWNWLLCTEGKSCQGLFTYTGLGPVCVRIT
jgi:hypothetical protein